MQVTITEGNSQFISGILGSISTTDLLNRINSRLQQHVSTNFNHVRDVIERGKKLFVENIIQTQTKLRDSIRNTLKSLFNNEDKIRALLSDDDFKNVPPVMHDCILRFRPIRKLHLEDRIFGFGYDAKKIPNNDPYARLIHNGTCRDIFEKVENDQPIRCISIWKVFDELDMKLSLDDIEAIEETRNQILKMLERKIDPTDFPNEIA